MDKKRVNIPNILTVIRLILVPVVVALIANGKFITAFIFFAIACITDVADGYIARTYNMITKLGTWLDPLADKLMAIGVVITFTVKGCLPLWVIIIIVTKELLMLIGGFILLKKDIVIPSNKYGKAAGLVLNFSIVLVFFCEKIAPYHLYFVYLAIVIMIVAFVQYVFIAYKKVMESKK